jgi:hypothetical protein
MAFNPKHLSLAEGKKRTLDLMKKHKVDLAAIITSQDTNMKALQKELVVGDNGIPKGFVKWQLPLFFPDGCLNYFSYGAPNAEVGEHSHDEGQQLRVIMNGSISYKGNVLAQGDWMYVPAGKKYSFTVGPQGVGMFYCYACCCWVS